MVEKPRSITSDPFISEQTISVVYANEEQQLEIELEFLPGENIRDAIQRSGILQAFPEIDLHKGQNANRIGVFSRFCELEDQPHEGDRIEIYRPLKVDPKQARRSRAMRQG